MPEFDDLVDADMGHLLHHQRAYELLIHSEVVLPHQNQLHTANILCRSVDPTGRSVGNYHKKPILNSLVYNVEFPDGRVKK